MAIGIVGRSTALLAACLFFAAAPARAETKQCRVVTQSEVVNTGELLKEALGVVGSSTLLLLSIRKGAASIALAAEGAIVLKEMAGLAPHLSHAVQLQRLRSYFGLGENDKLEICPAGNSLAAGLGFQNVTIIGPAKDAGPAIAKPFARPSDLTRSATTFDPFNRDIAEALRRFQSAQQLSLNVVPQPLQPRPGIDGLKLGQPSGLETYGTGELFKTLKSPGTTKLLTMVASFTGTLRGVVLDPSGNGIASASIHLTEDKTKIQSVIKTDHAGKYSADGIVRGDYTVTAGAETFTEQRKFARVAFAAPAELNFVLSKAAALDCDYRVTNTTTWPVRVGQVSGAFSVRLAANETTVFSKLSPGTQLRGATELPDPAYVWNLTVSCQNPSARLGPPRL
jgi:hypothetical protein